MSKRLLLIFCVGFLTTVYSEPGYDENGDKQKWRRDEQSNSSSPIVRKQRQTNGATFEIEVIKGFDIADLQNKETSAISPLGETQHDQQLKAEINSILTALGASNYQGKSTENKFTIPGPPENKTVANTESYDYSNSYYDRDKYVDDSENIQPPPPRRGNRGPPPPPYRRWPPPYHQRGHRRPPPRPYNDYRFDYYDHPRSPPRGVNDDRQTRQSSRYPPPPGHRPPRPYRRAPPDHRGPPDWHQRGPPPPPPRHRGGPPDRWHDGGPPRRGGPPNRWHDGGAPHRGGPPDRWRDAEPPHRGGQGHRPHNGGPPPRFDDKPPPPPPDDPQNNQNENDDTEYMLDVRFADELSAQTNASEAVPFLFQATPVTPENE